MVNFKQLFSRRTAPLFWLSLFLLMAIIQVEGTKIAYKKSIDGKTTNVVKEKRLKPKMIEESSTTTKTTTVVPLAPPPLKNTTTTTTTPATTMQDELEVAETTHAVKTELHLEEKPNETEINEQQVLEVKSILDIKTENANDTTAVKNSMEFQEAALLSEDFVENKLETKKSTENEKNVKLDWEASQEHSVVEEPPNSNELITTVSATTAVITVHTTAENLTSTTSTTSTAASTTAATDATTPSNRPVACTCGVFMTSQIKRTGNPYEPPIGRPVIINELDRTYPCTAVGQKQCQTKCLETIVQHLPNSANILCASLDHDIRKERAYLFIKNCRNHWYNTNLAAGREYCCKNGQPYQCPLV